MWENACTVDVGVVRCATSVRAECAARDFGFLSVFMTSDLRVWAPTHAHTHPLNRDVVPKVVMHLLVRRVREDINSDLVAG